MKQLLIVLGLLTAFVGFALYYRTAVQTELQNGEFGGVSLRLEIADTPEELERGLGGRESVPGDYGMLFVFPQPGLYGFWMKDTLVPLDIFWLDDKGQVLFMLTDVATSTYPTVFRPDEPVRYVLETAAGFARAHAVRIGTPLILQSLPTVSH